MAGTTIKVKVRILICPNESLLNEPEGRTWPRPANVPVQLTRTGRGAAQTGLVDLGLTTSKGETRQRELDRGIYEVDALGAYFEVGALDLTQARDIDTLDVRLVPRDNRWLMMLHVTDSQSGSGVGGASVTITGPQGFEETFSSYADGHIYGVAPETSTDVTLQFNRFQPASGEVLIPSDTTIQCAVKTTGTVDVVAMTYWPPNQISFQPTVRMPDGTAPPLTSTRVTVEYRGMPGVTPFSDTGALGNGESAVSFEYPFPGLYVATVVPPAAYAGLPTEQDEKQYRRQLSGDTWVIPAEFAVVPTEKVEFRLVTPQNRSLAGDFPLQIVGPPGQPVQSATVTGTSFTVNVPKGESLKVRLDNAALPEVNVPEIGDVPLVMSPIEQAVEFNQTNTIVLQYEHSLTIQAIDERGRPAPGAMVDVYYEQSQDPIATIVVGQQGSFLLGLAETGTYYLGEHTVGGMAQLRESIPVNPPQSGTVTIHSAHGTTGRDGEAVTELSAYPVLTEEITTTGPPAPSAGGLGAGGPGAGYGHTVDQVIRDVLGWRPSGDVSGFQAALTGAFQLREMEGHTEWSWQQRGYAVQADMGALTGAQASIYARARSALDQIQPLLAGLTTLNPANYEPQDLEAIRSVVGTELQELVSELALEGGPRIQRVDQLFSLLLGEGRKSRSMNPDLVQGNLGTLRERFALTVDEIQTVDEERIVTNFRIIVEQVLTLHASWNFDRQLLSGVGPKAALGTILIWLSRGLEAVCESVDDLTFALDSVYVDAAQRQVIELRFANLVVQDVPEVPLRGNPPRTMSESFRGDEAPMFLSDLLDWVLRVSRDEGPRIIQDAGKDGVLAFTPVLNKLRVLVRATGQISRERNARNALPAGMRTPRVDRAIKVLADQLDEAANLASLVRVEAAPRIAYVTISPDKVVDMPLGYRPQQIETMLTGSNFRGPATAILMAEDDEDLPEQRASATVITPSTAKATFNNPGSDPNNAGTTWVVSIVNNDGTQSVPIEVLRVPR